MSNMLRAEQGYPVCAPERSAAGWCWRTVIRLCGYHGYRSSPS